MSIAGMTGTRLGATKDQMVSAAILFARHNVEQLHDGWAIGADLQLFHLARSFGVPVVIHPPLNPKYRAPYHIIDDNCLLGPEKGYQARNCDIVDDCNFLFVFPKKNGKPITGGTGNAYRYAVEVEKPVIIIWPNGIFEYERWPT